MDELQKLLDAKKATAASGEEEPKTKKLTFGPNMAKIDVSRLSPLAQGLIRNDYLLVIDAIRKVPVLEREQYLNTKDEYGFVPIFYCLEDTPIHFACLTLLLDFGANPAALEPAYMASPLHIAAQKNSKKIMNQLVRYYEMSNFEKDEEDDAEAAESAKEEKGDGKKDKKRRGKMKLINLELSGVSQKAKDLAPPLQNQDQQQASAAAFAYLVGCFDGISAELDEGTKITKVERNKRSYWRSIFDEVDNDEQGVVSLRKFQPLFDRLAESRDQFGCTRTMVRNENDGDVISFFEGMDINQDGAVTFPEFLFAVVKYTSFVEKGRASKVKPKKKAPAKKPPVAVASPKAAAVQSNTNPQGAAMPPDGPEDPSDQQ